MNETVMPYRGKADPAQGHFQYLEDIATGYWYSESLFAALELRLFHYIEEEAMDTSDVARAAGCRPAPLGRLLHALAQMALVERCDGRWCNTPLSRKYLLPDEPAYMGDFLLYRRYLLPQWRHLADRVEVHGTRRVRLSPHDDYERRNFHYVRAVDRLARLKRHEIAHVVSGVSWRGPVLDVGGGGGALSRYLIQDRPEEIAVLLDLPEVLAAARRIYPLSSHWDRLLPVACDFRFSTPIGRGKKFGLVILSNFLHAYGPEVAEGLLARARDLLQPDGLILIHDYFPDVHNEPSPRGGLHDVNMMLNTCDGVCHESGTVASWLTALGLDTPHVIPLPSDSAVIFASPKRLSLSANPRRQIMGQKAVEMGFQRAVPLDAEKIKTAPWAQVKCRFGCSRYGRSLQCPPHVRAVAETGQLLKSYTRALLLVDQPPGRSFHDRLLEMERTAFLNGYHKALAFGAGPCTLCETCDTDRPCRFPERARPSMEASGMDVYETARACGVNLAPVTERNGYVKYIGLLLLE